MTEEVAEEVFRLVQGGVVLDMVLDDMTAAQVLRAWTWACDRDDLATQNRLQRAIQERIVWPDGWTIKNAVTQFWPQPRRH